MHAQRLSQIRCAEPRRVSPVNELPRKELLPAVFESHPRMLETNSDLIAPGPLERLVADHMRFSSHSETIAKPREASFRASTLAITGED